MVRELPWPSDEPAWRPLLVGSRAERAVAAILRIVDELPREVDAPGLSDGAAGLALLFAFLERWRPGAGYRDRAERFLEASLAQASARPLGPGFCQGLAGIGWVVRLLIPETADELLGELDDTLLAWVRIQGEHAPRDRVAGLAGVGFYALAPGALPGSLPLLEAVLSALGCPPWPTPPGLLGFSLRGAYPDGCYDLGAAHGVPGILAFLAQARAKVPGLETKVLPLLEGGMAWLLEQTNPWGSPSAFPPVIPLVETLAERRERAGQRSRIGWCYGDLGTGCAILAAGRGHDPRWTAKGLELLRGAASRCLEEAGLHDACLCHGGAGNAHLFNRVYQATGDPLFRGAAEAYFDWTLAFQQSGRGMGGFPKRTAPNADGSPGWEDAPGVLIGSAGVALALLAGLAELEPVWDGFLVGPF